MKRILLCNPMIGIALYKSNGVIPWVITVSLISKANSFENVLLVPSRILNNNLASLVTYKKNMERTSFNVHGLLSVTMHTV